MRRILFPLLLFYFSAGAQPFADTAIQHSPNYTARTKTTYFTIGDRKLPVKIQQYGDVKDIVFFNLHDDENTSVDATRNLLEKYGGLLIEIENNHKRNIRFRLGNTRYEFDPNRIFSKEGVRQTLSALNKRVNDRTISEVENFGQWLLKLIPENPDCVIALHNNTEGAFSVTDYLPGNKRSEATLQIQVQPGQDSDDFFLTTDEKIFTTVKSSGFNVLLQNNRDAFDDGSLSIFCGRNNIPYVNLETEHGKLKQYRDMMEVLLNHILVNAGYQCFNYSINLIKQSVSPGFNFSNAVKIFFNEKEVGRIRSVETDLKDSTLKGELLIHKAFKIYSNADFFLLEQSVGDPIIEIRIDPTREKNSIEPQTDRIQIKAKEKPLD